MQLEEIIAQLKFHYLEHSPALLHPDTEIDLKGNVAAILVDAVLQAGLSYESVVKRRVDSVLSDYPELTRISDLSFEVQLTSFWETISWKKDSKKGETLVNLIKYLENHNIETADNIREHLSDENNYWLIQTVKGFKEKSTDYLRILCGEENTLAIDSRLTNFVCEANPDARNWNYGTLKTILMALAKELKVAPVELDFHLWNWK